MELLLWNPLPGFARSCIAYRNDCLARYIQTGIPSLYRTKPKSTFFWLLKTIGRNNKIMILIIFLNHGFEWKSKFKFLALYKMRTVLYLLLYHAFKLPHISNIPHVHMDGFLNLQKHDLYYIILLLNHFCMMWTYELYLTVTNPTLKCEPWTQLNNTLLTHVLSQSCGETYNKQDESGVRTDSFLKPFRKTVWIAG